MRRYDNFTEFHREVQRERREEHKSSIVRFWFPITWAVILGVFAGPLVWSIFNLLNAKPSPQPTDYALVFSFATAFIFLVVFLVWWIITLSNLNSDAHPRPAEPYTPTRAVRYEIDSTPNHKAYCFLTLTQSQLEQVAAFAVEPNATITYRKLWLVFGREDQTVEKFRQEAIGRGYLAEGNKHTLVPTLKGIEFFNDVLDGGVNAILDPDPPPTPPPPVTSESPMPARHKPRTQGRAQ
jgi:hypothetical protein